MSTVTIEEAQTNLPDLIAKVGRGEEVLIVRDAHPVAQLIGPRTEKPQPVFGRGRGKLIVVSDDDEHLKDFEDYMP